MLLGWNGEEKNLKERIGLGYSSIFISDRCAARTFLNRGSE